MTSAPVSSWEKYRLLLWKNWLLQWSSKWSVAFEMLLPIIIVLPLIGVRSAIPLIFKPEQTFKPIDLYNLEHNYFSPAKKELYYSPKNPIFDKIVKEAVAQLSFVGYKAFDNGSALEQALIENNVIAGVQFNDQMSNISKFPEKLNFAIRQNATDSTWLAQRLFKAISLSSFPDYIKDDDDYISLGYNRKGFLAVQHAISSAYIKLSSQLKVFPNVIAQRFPYPAHMRDDMVLSLRFILAFIILLCYVYPAGILVKNITSEKQKQLKEIMKMMGLQNWIHWAAWFMRAFISWGITAVFICTLLKIPIKDGAAVLKNSDWSALLFFLLIYVAVSICFTFMIAIFFNKPSTAAAVGTCVWFVQFAPFLLSLSGELGPEMKWICLLPNSALGLSIKMILEYEVMGEGLQWRHLFQKILIDDDALAAYIGIMLLSALIFIIICLYLEQIFPGEYGLPKKWYFLFTKNYWFGAQNFTFDLDHTGIPMSQRNSTSFEAIATGKHAGLSVQNLHKRFGRKLAVKNLNMDMHEDEITVLLGHNGAGKTTTISMLCGMFPPTFGRAIVNGFDMAINTEEARSSLGICPQHNVLFDEMSVANHVVFYSRLKGIRHKTAIQSEVKHYLEILGLQQKADEKAKNLSGGMKRKLSMCCAFCGNTKVVLCDEPSSGMDPASRRQLWDLLQAEKIGRTILLTTHFMDEADALGDRIAIMCGGELKCYGSPFFLKKKYGTGYKLICVKRENCRPDEISALLRQFIPEVHLTSNIGAELTYSLPEEHIANFENMLAALEENSEKLNLNGYGIGISSMEEVFMKVGAERLTNSPCEERENGANFNANGHAENGLASNLFFESTSLLRSHKLILNQFLAMFLKNALLTWRNKLAILIQLLVTIAILIIALKQPIQNEQLKNRILLKPIKLTLTLYPKVTTILDSHAAHSAQALNISQNYKGLVNSIGKNYKLEETGSMKFENYTLLLGKTKQFEINRNYLTAASIDDQNITSWFNFQAYHSAPISLNLVHNTLAKTFIGEAADITVTNAPLPLTLTKYRYRADYGYILFGLLCFIMCFVTSFYVISPIKERSSRAKLLQFVSGANIWLYWVSQFLWDWLTFTFIALISTITIACLGVNGYSTFNELGFLFLVLLVFGISAVPFAYLVSLSAKQPATGFARSFVLNVITGLILILVYEMLKFETYCNILKNIFSIFPHFSLAMATSTLRQIYDSKNGSLDEPGTILPQLLYLIFTGIIYLLIVVLSEYKFIEKLLQSLLNQFRKESAEVDINVDDVERERARIAEMSESQKKAQNLVLESVSKYYRRFKAVNRVSFGVKSSECFGLLGVNGAGKTSIFKMLTGEELITFGEIYVKGLSLKNNLNKVYKEIGYCPQFDALLSDLTGRETLRIFCLLRGVPMGKINELIQGISEAFGFTQHLDKLTTKYSGGNKRKLSTALAVLGSPTVIYLDEPTSGMDPAARRQLWNMVCRIRDAGKSIVLTSHSMEECEALCTRLAIMVNGEFKCIGSTQHLKNQYSKGLILKMKIERSCNANNIASHSESNSPTDNRSALVFESKQICDTIKTFVSTNFPQSQMRDEFQDLLTFYIPLDQVKWSQIFGIIERNRRQLHIEDYSISQSSLEEIFIDFANLQQEDKRILK